MKASLEDGVKAYKAGKRNEARKIFIASVKEYPDNAYAWGWMYQVSETDQERIYALRKILRIKPDDTQAKLLLEQLLPSSRKSSPSESPSYTKVSSTEKTAATIHHDSKGKTNLKSWLPMMIPALILCLSLTILTEVKVQANARGTVTSSAQTSVVKTQIRLASISSKNLHSYYDNSIAASRILTNEIYLFSDYSFTVSVVGPEDDDSKNLSIQSLKNLQAAANDLASLEPVPEEFKIHAKHADQLALVIDQMGRNYVRVLNGDKNHYKFVREDIERVFDLIMQINDDIQYAR